jgi:hypothetical protein
MSVLVSVMMSKTSLLPFSATKVSWSAGLMVSSRPVNEPPSCADELALSLVALGDVIVLMD